MHTSFPSNTPGMASTPRLDNSIDLTPSPQGGRGKNAPLDDVTTIGGQEIVLDLPNIIATFRPRNQEDIDKRSRIMSRVLQRIRAIAKSVLQGGTISEDKQWFQSQDWCVRIAGEANSPLPIGGFYNIQTGQYGFDLIELFSILRNLNYFQAMEALVEHLAIASDCDSQADQKKRYIQEKTPLSSPPLPYGAVTTHFAPPEHVSVYRSAAGLPIGLVFYWVLPNGQLVSQHTTLWRHGQSEILHWVDLFPVESLTLYNAHLIKMRPCDAVHFFSNEVLADNALSIESEIPSACPGGNKNLVKADLKQLVYREVRIDIDADDTLYALPQVLKKMKHAGVKKVQLYFSETNTFASGEDFLQNPIAFGYYKLAIECVEETALSSDMISKPGESLPGSKINRKMLITPIIREGEIAWLYGKEKAGKSWLGLSFAYIASKGNCEAGKWTTQEQVEVLYVDGEMLPDDLDNNTKMVMRGFGDMSEDIPFSRLCAKSLAGGAISILDEDWQKTIEDSLSKGSLLILDNFYCLTDNKVSDIKAVGVFLHRLSQKGIATLMLDHTNAEGELQGSITKRRMANLSMEIKSAKSNKLYISYPAARRLHGEDEKPHTVRKFFSNDSFHIELVKDVEAETPISDRLRQMARIKYLHDHRKLSFPKIAAELGIIRSTAHQQYHVQIPKLPVEELEQLEQEVARIMSEKGS